jgi:aspartokinase-like uncharacterized kinase
MSVECLNVYDMLSHCWFVLSDLCSVEITALDDFCFGIHDVDWYIGDKTCTFS